jgi:DNA-binding SARP family transcriptional activator
MTAEAAVWRLELLGGARLVGVADGAPRTLALERKAAGVLAYLALEGPTQKYRLAGLVWPDSGEERARNNMRQLLRRLRLATGGAEPVTGQDVIQLAEQVVADAALLQAHAFAGRHAEALALEGELLAHLEYDDCPDFGDWLWRARESLRTQRRQAAEAEAERLEAAGDVREALRASERLLALEPASEEGCRRLMRLRQARGDRGGALEAYARLRRVLREELDAAPSEETVALARRIERGEAPAPTPPAAVPLPRPLPASVLRPPSLVGREAEWAALAEAWRTAPLVLLVGEPGVGKTRLALDFAAAQGAYAVLSGRPGDADVPYATYVRHLRERLGPRPGVLGALAPWVRREVSRLLPEAAAPGEAMPPPLASEGDRQRFLGALCELLVAAHAGVGALVCDDVQFFDDATLEVGEFAQAYLRERPGALPRLLDVARGDELRPGTRELLDRMERVGDLRRVEVGPLSPSAVQALLDSLGLPGAAGLALQVARYTGGNPLFVTETLKHLLELGSLERGWPERLPPPGRVRALIQQRLARLPPAALQLAQVAALAGTHFSLELAAEVLETGAFALAPAVQELEAAQVLRHERFTHDLVFEAVREALPTSLAALLHRRLAGALERQGAPAAVVARHWEEGRQPARALPFLLAAAAQDAAALRHREAAALYGRAAALLAESGQAPDAAEARARAQQQEARAGGSDPRG